MTTDYELWATQHGMAGAQLVQVLQFSHPGMTDLWVCDYGVPFEGTSEAPTAFTATPVSFTCELPASNPTTQQELQIKMDSLGGAVVAYVRGMTDAQRALPVQVFYRVYLDTDPGAPCLDPLQFVVTDLSATRIAAQINCAATVLPNVGAGIRYTIDQFPTLAYL
jgi:hypothetical protein